MYSLVFLICFFYSSLIFAIVVNNRQWTELSLQGSLFNTQPFRYIIEAQSRFDCRFDKIEEQVFRSLVGYKFNPNLTFSLGYQWDSRNFITRRKPINRTLQQLEWTVYKKDRVSITKRSRLEERKLENQLEWNTRFRQQVRIEVAKFFANKYSGILWDEVFINCNRPSWVHTNTMEQNRIFAGIGIPTSKSSSVQIGYLNQYIFRHLGDHMNHILFVGYSYKQH